MITVETFGGIAVDRVWAEYTDGELIAWSRMHNSTFYSFNVTKAVIGESVSAEGRNTLDPPRKHFVLPSGAAVALNANPHWEYEFLVRGKMFVYDPLANSFNKRPTYFQILGDGAAIGVWHNSLFKIYRGEFSWEDEPAGSIEFRHAHTLTHSQFEDLYFGPDDTLGVVGFKKLSIYRDKEEFGEVNFDSPILSAAVTSTVSLAAAGFWGFGHRKKIMGTTDTLYVIDSPSGQITRDLRIPHTGEYVLISPDRCNGVFVGKNQITIVDLD